MKRSSENIEGICKKVFLLDRETDDNLTTNRRTTYQDSLLFKTNNSEVSFRYLQDMISEVLPEVELHNELNNAMCNFVKRPGHIYHLYERFLGIRYFSMLSPQEWGNAPHKYIGSWRLEMDNSWTDPRREPTSYR